MQNPEMTKNTMTAAGPLNTLFHSARTAQRITLLCGLTRMGYRKWPRKTHRARMNRRLEIGNMRFNGQKPLEHLMIKPAFGSRKTKCKDRQVKDRQVKTDK